MRLLHLFSGHNKTMAILPRTGYVWWILILCSLLHHITATGLHCGSRLYAGRGIIKSPNFPSKYPSDIGCEWTLIAEDTGHVTLTFEAFELEESPGCYYDYVEVYDGDSQREPLLGKFCGTTKPRIITSSSQAPFVRFVTDSSIERLGFSANYSTGCSRTLFGPRGTVTSPNYPGRYLDNLNCIFKIVVGRHKVIRLIFRAFSVEGGTAYCSYDYLEIRDGSSAESKSIGRFCGEEDPGVLVSTGNTMMLRFVTDESVKMQGFMLEYEATAVNPAATDPCMVDNGGCSGYCRVDGDGNAVCDCLEGYELDSSGKDCVDIDECQRSESCPHICVNLEGSYRCECLQGFQVSANGKACDDINECDTSNGGCSQLCFNTRGSFYCGCQEAGMILMDDLRTCAPEIIETSCRDNNGGCQQVCHERVGGHYCSCHAGYNLAPNGINCTDVDECLTPATEQSSYSNHCNQRCLNTPGSYYCDCDEGFELSPNGRVCKDVDECATELRYQCEHDCINFPGGFRCQCFPGYRVQPMASTIKCVDIDECDPPMDDCHVCTNLEGGFECGCREGFASNENRTGCLDINECDINNGGCQQVCVNLPGSHECRCRSGFQGTDLSNTICVDIDECAADRSGPCDHLCSNSQGSFECTCRSGFYLREDKLTCADIDECQDRNGGCSQQCINTPGAWTCKCFDGFRARNPEVPDADVCVDVDECREDIHRCVASEEAICQNTAGNYTCSCPNGFETYEWLHCRDIDECSESSLNSCQQICNNTLGGHICTCENGYVQINETHCRDINECDLGICDHNDLCSNSNGSFTCRCHEGFYLTSDGVSCSDVDECKVDNGHCQQICINDRGGHRCDCEEGFKLKKNGQTCKDVNECETDYACCNQMHNCVNLPGTYTCSCDPGFYMDADNCTCLDINECELNNGGCDHICTNYDGGHNCSCQEGYEQHHIASNRCRDIDECATENGGCDHFCSNFPGGFNCSCQANSKLGIDGSSCRPCPTCENFEEMQELITDLMKKVDSMTNIIEELRRNNTRMEIRLRHVEDWQSGVIEDRKFPGNINVIN
ncbi:uncharacterized protein [Diadema antillarum]|uniref:uncharacterized protein n=1 Tax=Diadema antillarum TaxID=105358 RepID=UPI003A87F7EB